MKLSELGERKIIQVLEGIVRHDPRALTRFKDDAFVKKVGERFIVVSTDMGFASTHFTALNPADVGKKIISCNASDLLATGATPSHAVIDVAFPREFEMGFVEKLYEAMDSEMEKYGGFIAGGDTNEFQEFLYSVTMMGFTKRPLLRSGAKEADLLTLTGEVGGAAAGYMMRTKGFDGPDVFLKAQDSPDPDYELCTKIMPSAHAGIDVSDGLAFELNEVAKLSNKKLVVEWDKVPFNKQLPKFCKENGLDLFDVVFHYGEDYNVVYSTPQNVGRVFGRVEAPSSGGPGVWLEKDGKQEKIESKGWEHFR